MALMMPNGSAGRGLGVYSFLPTMRPHLRRSPAPLAPDLFHMQVHARSDPCPTGRERAFLRRPKSTTLAAQLSSPRASERVAIAGRAGRIP